MTAETTPHYCACEIDWHCGEPVHCPACARAAREFAQSADIVTIAAPVAAESIVIWQNFERMNVEEMQKHRMTPP